MADIPRELRPIEDSDMDSLFILPLDIVPLKTPALARARMIKNSRLKTVVEIFSDIQTGSGQVEVENLPALMDWPTDVVHPDLATLRSLALLPSYDVYSLRILLRQKGISVNDHTPLMLSKDKMRQLRDYMVAFTRPLVKLIYTDNSVEVEDYDDLIKLFRDPDVARARERLVGMARSLLIDPMDVPRFLEDCGDTFMSLSYYQHCLDRLEPYFTACLGSIDPIRKHFQLSQNAALMRSCNQIEDTVNSITATLTGSLETFSRRTRDLWTNVTPGQFREVKLLVERYHVSIGAALCALTVKMNAFARSFPLPQSGGPVRRADFMMTEMTQGIEAIRAADAAFRQKPGQK
jgi:hypothetical protein